MSPNTRLFVVAGLLVALGLAVFVSPFASGEPDGLEKVADEQGFADEAAEHDLASSPVADYRVESVEDDGVATGLAGLVGVLLTFGVAVGAFALLRVLRPSSSAASPGAGPQHGATSADGRAGDVTAAWPPSSPSSPGP